jgi:hypothetical protein
MRGGEGGGCLYILSTFSRAPLAGIFRKPCMPHKTNRGSAVNFGVKCLALRRVEQGALALGEAVGGAAGCYCLRHKSGCNVKGNDIPDAVLVSTQQKH